MQYTESCKGSRAGGGTRSRGQKAVGGDVEVHRRKKRRESVSAPTIVSDKPEIKQILIYNVYQF